MIDEDSSINGENGSGTGEASEAASIGRCPTGWQGGPGRHPGTATMKWNRDMNIAVIECYYLSKSVDKVADQSKDIDRECMLFGGKEIYQR